MTSNEHDALPQVIKDLIENHYSPDNDDMDSYKRAQAFTDDALALGYDVDYDLAGEITYIKKLTK